MISLGFMALSPTSENTYFNEIAKRAESYGIECFRFVPSNINPLNEQVTGLRYDCRKDRWVEDYFSIPTFLYDRCFYNQGQHSEQCKPIVHWLKNRPDKYFLGHGLPNKWELYYYLNQFNEISPYLPSTKKAISEKDIWKDLHQHKQIIIKPYDGSQGKHIYLLTKYREGIKVETDVKHQHIEKFFTEKATFIEFLEALLSQETFLIQPKLPLTNHQDHPFDIRILLQKAEDGRWNETGRGIRLGESNFITSNLKNGAGTISFEQWLKTIPSTFHHFLSEELTFIINKLPSYLEDRYAPLFELGVDIGFAMDGSIWILDINSKPGRKVILNHCADNGEKIYLAPLQYCQYIATLQQTHKRGVLE